MQRVVHMLLACMLVDLLAGCVSVPRLPPPPTLLSNASPAGFPADIRLLTIDRKSFLQRAPAMFGRLTQTAKGGSIDYLVLSGGGSGGAFGAGALVGLSRAHARPQYEVVTGVSAGALLAPFAFLGPAWDSQLKSAFGGGHRLEVLHSKAGSALARLLFPRGLTNHNTLARLVDHYATNAMLQAIAAEWRKGRLLFVATTDLDKRETVLWNMGAIAAQGGEPALKLFRQVLIASASVPGIFPPVLIRVRDGDREYDEMHVDGSVTTSLFAAPHAAQMMPIEEVGKLPVNVYVIVNGKLAEEPKKTPLNTIDILSRSFGADLTYKMRDGVLLAMDYARKQHMHFQITEIPPAYPSPNFVDFSSAAMRALFDYAEGCAASGKLWESPEYSIRRNLEGSLRSGVQTRDCPGPSLEATP